MNAKKYYDQFMALEDAAKNEIVELFKKIPRAASSSLMNITVKMNCLQLKECGHNWRRGCNLSMCSRTF